MARERGSVETVSWMVVGHGPRSQADPPWPAEETSEPVQPLSSHIPMQLDKASTLQLVTGVTEAVARLSDLQWVDTVTGGEGVSLAAPEAWRGEAWGHSLLHHVPKNILSRPPHARLQLPASDPLALQRSPPLP